jgi:glycosyl transferase family 2
MGRFSRESYEFVICRLEVKLQPSIWVLDNRKSMTNQTGMRQTVGVGKELRIKPAESGRPTLAVLIPCHNEELSIGDVVRQFRAHLPTAQIYVFDNNSLDKTAACATDAGAIVFHEPRQGKGYVVQSMFRKVDADIYIMVDGDGTYPAEVVNELIGPIRRGEADMVIGSRLHHLATSDFHLLNRVGNRLFRLLLNSIFRVKLTDLLSGYRAFSRRLVRGLPLTAGGFQTETEMTIKALERRFTVVEIPVNLIKRGPGSHSKIRIGQDGFLILSTIFALFRDYRPLTFFGALGLGFILLGLLPGAVVVSDYLKTGLVPHLPSAILALGLVLSGLIFGLVGLILHTISRRFQEFDLQFRSFAEELRGSQHSKSAAASDELL